MAEENSENLWRRVHRRRILSFFPFLANDDMFRPESSSGTKRLLIPLPGVAAVYPDLVAYGPDGKPYAVKYRYLTSLLLNEMQKQYQVDEQADVI